MKIVWRNILIAILVLPIALIGVLVSFGPQSTNYASLIFNGALLIGSIILLIGSVEPATTNISKQTQIKQGAFKGVGILFIIFIIFLFIVMGLIGAL